MTPKERATRAKAYVDQALERFREAGPHLNPKDEGTALLVSLRANLESARDDLAALLESPQP